MLTGGNLTLTEKENKLVERIINKVRGLDYGEIPLVIYVHENKPMKIDFKGDVEKVVL